MCAAGSFLGCDALAALEFEFLDSISCVSNLSAPMVNLSGDAMVATLAAIASSVSAPTEPPSPRRSRFDLGAGPCILAAHRFDPVRAGPIGLSGPGTRQLSSVQQVFSPADHVCHAGTFPARLNRPALPFGYASFTYTTNKAQVQ